MNEKILLSIGATFGDLSKLKDNLQKELKKIEGQLKLSISNVELAGKQIRQNETDTKKSQTQRVTNIEKAHAQALAMEKKFNEKIGAQREKAEIKRREDEKKWNLKQTEEMNKAQDERYNTRQKELKDIEKYHAKAIEMNKKFDAQRIKQAESTRSKLNNLNSGGSSSVKIFDQIDRESTQSSFANKTSSAQSRLGNLSKSGVFSREQIAGINAELDGLNLRIGKITNNKLAKQWETDFGKINAKLSGMRVEVDKAAYSFSNMLQTGIVKMGVWSMAATAFYLPIRALQDMVKVITEVDSQLIEINKVLNLNQEELKELTKNATDVGITYGRTTTEVLKATAAFAKAGLDKDTAQNLGKLALLLANVGDISVESAEETLIAANAGYELNNSYGSLLGVIDKFNEIANKNATEVKEMASAWQASAATAKLAGLSIDQYNALIGTAQSTTQKSGAEIGNAWKTILMRMQGVSDGTDTLDEDLSKAEEALNSVGIAARNSEKEFRPAMDVLQELSAKYKDLSTVEKSYVTEALAGKYRANILKSTLANFNMVNKQIIESANATGSAMKENEAYLEGVEAKVKQLSAAWEKFSITFFNSNLYKGMIDFLTGTTQAATRVIETLGGLNTVFITLATVGLVKFLTSLYAVAAGETIATAATVGLSLAVKGLHTAILAFLTNPVTWMIAAIGTIGYGVVSWINHTKKLEEQNKAVTISQNNFNTSLDKFNRTLDSGAIAEMTEEVEKLKKALDYDETIKKIQELESQLEKANNATSKTAMPAFLKSQIDGLKNSLKPATDAMDALNKKIEDSKVINIEAQKAQVNKTVSTIKEIGEDKKLVAEYEKLLKSGEDEVEIRDQLLSKYPQFLTRLSQYGDRLGVNTGKLNDYLNVQEQVQRAEIASAQIAMRESMKKTKQLIADTKAIMALRKIEAATLYGSDEKEKSLNAIMNNPQANPLDKMWAKFNLSTISSPEDKANRQAVQNEILEYEKTIDQLGANYKYQNDFSNLNVDDVVKAYGATKSGYIPKDKDKDNSPSITAEKDVPEKIIEKDLYFLVNREIEKYQALISKNKALQENSTISEKNKLLKEQIEHYKGLQAITHQKAEISRGERDNLISVLSGVGIGGKFSGSGDNAVLTNAEAVLSAKIDAVNSHRADKDKTVYNKLNSEYQELLTNINRFYDLQEKELPNLSEQWWNYAKSIGDAKESITKNIDDIAEKQKKLAQEKLDAIESTEKLIQEIIKKGVDKQKDLYDEDLENYRKATDGIIDELDRRWEAEDYNKDINDQTKKRQLLQNEINVLSLDKSFGGQQKVRELKTKLADMDVKIADDQEKRKRVLVKQSLEDSLKAKEEDVDDKKKLLDKEFSDEKVRVLAHESLVNGSFKNITDKIPGFFNNLAINTSKGFLKILDQYNKAYGDRFENIVQTAKIAAAEVSKLNLLQTQANPQKTVSPIDKAKSDIGQLQNEWWQIDAMEKDGVATASDSAMKKTLNESANKLRAIYGLSDKEDFRGLVGSYADGGVNTQTGLAMLHGTPTKPEFILNYDQMKNFLSNAIASTPKFTPSMSAMGGINLAINVSGNADSGTITGIKNAGTQIITQMKKLINKNGVSR